MTRDFTVAVFIVHNRQVLLFYHKKHRMWLPPGGHIEENELPDDAAVREVMEETGIAVTLIGGRGLAAVNDPRQLVTPEGIQVERIEAALERHEHIDLIYFAVPTMDLIREGSGERGRVEIAFSAEEVEKGRGGWFQREEIVRMDLAADVRAWSIKALQEVPKRLDKESLNNDF